MLRVGACLHLIAMLCRYVCLYDVEDKILLRRVQISSNRSLDGVLDQLNSKEMTDAGPAQLLDDAASDEDKLLPPTTAGGCCQFSLMKCNQSSGFAALVGPCIVPKLRLQVGRLEPVSKQLHSPRSGRLQSGHWVGLSHLERNTSFHKVAAGTHLIVHVE